MSTLKIIRAVARKLRGLVEPVQRLRRAIAAAAEPVFQPARVLIPIRIVAERRARAYRRD